MRSRSGQTSIPEYIITLSIFLTLIMLISILTRQPQPRTLDTAESIANILLQEGQPAGWNTSSVIIPGILSNERLNQTKLTMLEELINTSHPSIKRISQQPFSITITYPNGTTERINTSPIPSQPRYRSITQRAVIINTSISMLTITTWQNSP